MLSAHCKPLPMLIFRLYMQYEWYTRWIRLHDLVKVFNIKMNPFDYNRFVPFVHSFDYFS
jgi:hypothetical protein